MADKKKHFVLYSDNKPVVDLMTNEQAGLLLKALFSYMNNEEPILDNSISLVFEMIKIQFERDFDKAKKIKESRSIAGKASVESKNLFNKREQSSTKSTSVEIKTKSVEEVIEEAEIYVFSFEEFWSMYPNKTNKATSKLSFDKLTDSEKERIEIHLPAFIKYPPFEQYNYPVATTYLNQKRFLDDLPTEKIKKNGTEEPKIGRQTLSVIQANSDITKWFGNK